MTPYLYTSLVHDRIDKARQRADIRRLMTQPGHDIASGRRSIREAFGQGLIAIGERLVDRPDTDNVDLRRAA